jgi:hypothetical protein
MTKGEFFSIEPRVVLVISNRIRRKNEFEEKFIDDNGSYLSLHNIDIFCFEVAKLVQKCSCGRDSRSFEACTPLGCNTFVVCTGCFKDVLECSCEPT